ncbi:MAG: hypothetical protein JWP89_5990 [Schlesneria sp.]|nr:hypothetical protein [Schlesneria sp.]
MTGGVLVIEGRRVSVTEAWCSLFAGRLCVGFEGGGLTGGVSDIPMPIDDNVELSDLCGCTVSIADCESFFEDVVSKPTLSIENELLSIRRLEIYSVSYAADTNLLTVRLDLDTGRYDIVGGGEPDAPVAVKGEIIAEGMPVEKWNVLNSVGAIPVRFAKHYLPLIGIPGIPTTTTREELISQFGEPPAAGGGYQSRSVFVPEWVRYPFDHCYLHFRFSERLVSEVTIMSRSSPFAAPFE